MESIAYPMIQVNADEFELSVVAQRSRGRKWPRVCSDIPIQIKFQGETFTLATAMVNINGKHLVGEGVSRRSDVDLPNPQLGRAIAVGRAVKSLYTKVMEHRLKHHKFMG